MTDLGAFSTDKWYRALTYVGAVTFIAVVAIPNDAGLRKALILLTVGAILVGLGQWIDHTYQQQVGPGFTISGHPYRPSVGGTVVQLIGLALAGRAIWLLW